MDMISVYKLHTLKINTHRSYSNKPEIVRQSELVQALNSLHSLKISFIDEILTNNFQKVNINLEKLSTLSSVIHIFDFKSLKFLDLSWNLDMKSCKASALKFLSQQNNLKEFGLWESNGEDFFKLLNFMNIETKFSLEKFSFHNYEFTHHEALIKFLNNQKTTLKSLKLDLITITIQSIEQMQKYALENLTELKELDLFMHVADNVEGNYNEPFENDEPRFPNQITNKLEYLGYRRLHRTLDEDKNFIDKFGNLKILNLQTSYDKDCDLLNYISITKIGLESLQLDMFLLDFIDWPRVYFPNLKKLSLNDYDGDYFHMKSINDEVFSSFIAKHCKTLEEISIRELQISQMTIDALASCKKLSYLELARTVKWIQGEAMSLPILWSIIKMLKYLPHKYSRLTLKIASNTFYFPGDLMFWNQLFPTNLFKIKIGNLNSPNFYV
ncbi:unnamed protein product [Chironomus riparius]|uniref:Uncharacterized protein n=1 Tax=Chironomus riparius TaxID=315576 RepID=A0A9N9RZW5_9DIPT|nr:unnamed protein product [Chironomus riparius]